MNWPAASQVVSWFAIPFTLGCRQEGPSRLVVTRPPSSSAATAQLDETRDTSHTSPLGVPPPGTLYHSVFPGSASDPGSEDAIVRSDVDAYETAVGHRVAWVYFSHEWAHGEAFPLRTSAWIRDRGSIPFIRMMMRSVAETGRTTREPKYTVSSIIAGKHDAALAAWGRAAVTFATPILAEWGTEMNGDWFPWNASHNGKESGAERFREAYAHIVNLVRTQGAKNVLWVFHINGDDQPANSWNRFEGYYPGDDAIDWLGISAYGAQSVGGPCTDFATYVDPAVARLEAMARSKPVFVLEFGTTKRARRCVPSAAAWTERALDALVSGRWPSVRGFSWWNEQWDNDDAREPTDMRVQDEAAFANAFRRALSRGRTVDRPLVQ